MAKVKFVFFVPVKDNNGRPLQAEIDDLEMDLTIHFVGWTFQGYVRGYYGILPHGGWDPVHGCECLLLHCDGAIEAR